MKNKVKKLINFRFDHYKDIEIRLEKLAAKGLFLESCGTFLWTFSKGEPKNLKYTVTYFSEGSLFNPDITDNQQTYFDYAKAADWHFITQFNQMQIFCSEAENPIPFETDEREKFENIKRCMKKSFLPAIIVMILVFLLNLVVQFNSFQLNPIDFLSDKNRLFPVAMIFTVILYFSYALIDYVIWCKRSARSIASGGTCIENTSGVHRIVDISFMCCIFGILGWFLFNLAWEGNWFILIFGIVQTPILFIAFWSSIKYLKKKKVAAMLNKVISVTVLTIATFAYLALIVLLVMRFDFYAGNESDYRTINWKITPTTSDEYRLYSDEIPLTCEDLYGQTDYDYYSYEKKVDSTIFLTNSCYRQDSLPAKDAPPRLAYEILESQFDFVYHLAREHLLTIPHWRNDSSSFKSLNNGVFDTTEAYQEYYEDNPTGEYVLFFEDKIIRLEMEKPPTSEQVAVIKDKLQF